MPNELQHLSQSEFKSLKKLTQKKYRELEKRFLIEGVHLVEDALGSNWEVEQILVTDVFQQSKVFTQIVGQARKRKVLLRSISEQQLEQLSDAVTSQGILGVVKTQNLSLDNILSGKSSLVVALDSVGDPGNVGTILRTCDWFGVDAVLLSKNSVELFNPKVLRSTMGAIFHLPIYQEIDLPKTLSEAKHSGYTIISTQLHDAQPLPLSSFPKKSIIIFGSEAHGISPKLMDCSDIKITIPRFGKAESLNVAISCGVVLGLIRLNPL